MILSRRRFTIGCAATASCALLSGRLGNSEPAPFTTPLPLPRLIDAAASRHAVNLIAMPGRHAFVEGKPVRTYGYSAPVLTRDPRSSRRRGANGRGESSEYCHDSALAWATRARPQ